ncbi:glycoside hydrolase family 88 protein [Bacillus sp. ISL-40]|uniref:glycoside hydrolase family 88 protein n=1 Tax=unclassified Bacillus (in: firmicutes) TaxID=185979 RepID=UPI001BED117C|nr:MULTISPECIES: glycoside hydrolase family 88 protein [unclassified Bacillus (in: firmicutes)]MBT2699447.1 glycoside hydrolase family 88 protein [Bacillus sp. ISL-40]MBT2721977.1 glycoside hydrolase family 88 protein [Bacillus sp. ISL-46]MBT2741674.1 glycoside hydrolase family 88 protein [Bacillus sp. ISL-77]
MITKIVCIGLLSFAALILFFDITPVFKDWLKRIKLGRFEDKQLWNKFITEKGVKWLIKTPKIKVTDNTRLILLDILKGNYSKSAIQHWQEASLILGITEYLKYKEDNAVKMGLLNFLNSKFDNTGNWLHKPKNIDAAILAYAIMKIEIIDNVKYQKALDFIWEIIRDHIGDDGTVKYRKSMESYRYVDTIGFICPFLIAYGFKFDKKECIDLAVKQIKEYEKYGMLDIHWIPSHAYKIENTLPQGLYGWGRGLGWFAIGLIDAWNELPHSHKYKASLEESVVKFAKSIMHFQQDNGSWNWQVGRSECRADSSTTATLGWFMINASVINSISKDCQEGTNKALNYLMKVTRRNGEVDFSQGDTKDIGVYSTLFNILPFTQGFCIRLINLYENQRLKKNYVNKSS